MQDNKKKRLTLEYNKNKCQFSTPIQADVVDKFKEKCKENQTPMNVVIETFMRQYAAGEFDLTLTKRNCKYLVEMEKNEVL